ncbi:hypothetical protein GLOIN_2v1730649 [Rhizophagus clarus]|uniref:Uncharacterized protein n=1 Tax=Rhizophagus clarus TaxID=94130 RepID=A0A8H3QYY2_9GLOM|nr:hypothetical protein GLOIN_2v1730649 [Rhizophagus clarus]
MFLRKFRRWLHNNTLLRSSLLSKPDSPGRDNTQLSFLRTLLLTLLDFDRTLLVLTKSFRSIISIKIKEDETIGELEKCIKAEKITSELLVQVTSDCGMWISFRYVLSD